MNQDYFEFIINKEHYFIPTQNLNAFSSSFVQNNKNNRLIYFDDLIDPYGYFNMIVDLFYGKTIEINEENAFFLGFIADKLGIEELAEATNSYRQIELTTDNIFNILIHLSSFHITDIRIIKFFSENWTILSQNEKTLHLPFYILNEFFSQNPQISADFDFVMKVIDANTPIEKIESAQYSNEYITLFKYCDFQKLSSSEMEQIFEYAMFDTVPQEILEKFIQNMLIQCEISVQDPIRQNQEGIQNFSRNKKEIQQQKQKANTTQSKSQQQSQISKMQRKEMKAESPNVSISKQHLSSSSSNNSCQTLKAEKDCEITYHSYGVKGSRNGKPSPILPSRSSFVDVMYEQGYELRGVVKVFQDTPSLRNSLWKKEVLLICPESKKNELRYSLFDHTSKSWWSNFDGTSSKIENAWIIVGFPKYTLRLTYYTLASNIEKVSMCQPMSWKVFGSNDPNSFSEDDLIDYVKSAPSMNAPSPIKTFQVTKKTKPYSYFKFVMLKNYAVKYQYQGEFNLSGLELFGILTAK